MLQTFEVNNIRCGGCANTITKSLQESGFENITVDLSCEPRKVTAEIADEAQLAQFKAILRTLGYPLNDEKRGFTEETILKAKSFVSCAVGKIN
ncbi:MAG: cation transporter [Campylobacterales bacterium]|nr:cation transporter [Campylobacterales bacterium]